MLCLFNSIGAKQQEILTVKVNTGLASGRHIRYISHQSDLMISFMGEAA